MRNRYVKPEMHGGHKPKCDRAALLMLRRGDPVGLVAQAVGYDERAVLAWLRQAGKEREKEGRVR